MRMKFVSLLCAGLLLLPSLAMAASFAYTTPAAGAPTSQLFFNVKDYGVKGDGVTDDQPAILALLARIPSNAHIHFPAGTYVNCRSTGSSPADNIVSDNLTITGDGPATIFDLKDSTCAIPNNAGSENYNLFQMRTPNVNLTLRDFAWRGFGAILRCMTCTNVMIDHVYGEGLQANAGAYLYLFPIFLNATTNTKITNSHFHNFRTGIYLSGGVGTETIGTIISGNSFWNNVAAGSFTALFPASVYIFHAKDTVVTGNTFKDIYSSFDNGTASNGMAYGFYEADGQSDGLIVSNNKFTYTGNGSKNATAIMVATDSNASITGNVIDCIGAARCAVGIRSLTAVDKSIRSITNNTIRSDTLTNVSEYAILIGPGVNSSTNTNTIDVAGNIITGPWSTGIRLESEQLGNISIRGNTITYGTLSQIRVVGTSTAFQRLAIRGNTITRGQKNAIEIVQTTVGTIIENNTLLDGGLANGGGNGQYAIYFAGNSYGSVIRNNVIGNTPTGAGLFTTVVGNQTAITSRIFKDIIANNTLVGLTPTYVGYATTSPTTTFFDIQVGDIIANSTAQTVGGVPGWQCLSASQVALTADASNSSTTVTVASTTGYLAGDLIMLNKSNNPYITDFDDVTSYHTTTIASVTNSTTFVVTDAIPVGDGTYVSGTGYVTRARFFPVPSPTPSAAKFVSINVTVGTLSLGDITGAAFVNLTSTNATPGTQTTRTATLMASDIGGVAAGYSYMLRITNTGANTFTLGAGSNVTLTGTMTVLTNTYRDFIVTFTSTTACTIQTTGTGTIS